MHNLTLIIPAKHEAESLPIVLDELQKYNYNINIVLHPTDVNTIKALKNYNINIIYQKNRGYGDALIQGINSCKTKYFCIFNADGSFNPKELNAMYQIIENNKADLVFASRYEKDCSSEDDTFITFIGNFIFTTIGKIFFRLKITDILYTFVMGKTHETQSLNLKSKDFVFCVELPIKALRKKLKLTTSPSNERARIADKKKVSAFKDGFLILIGMIKLLFSK